MRDWARPRRARPRARGRGVLRVLTGAGGQVLSATTRVGETVVRQAAEVALWPPHATRLAGAVVRDGSTVVRLLLTHADPASGLKGDPGISRRVAWTRRLSLQQIKHIAQDTTRQSTTCVLAATSGALRHYLQERGCPPREIQAMVPFNLRPLSEPVPSELGNKFGLVFLPLPVGVSGSYRRLADVHNRMEQIKQSREGPVSYALLSAAGLTPEPLERRIVDLFTAKGTAVITNVPGPREPVYLAGTPVRTVLVWAPTSGHIGMSISIFSYRGEVIVGLMVDAELVPDPEAIVDQLERELEALATLEPQPRRSVSPERARSLREAAG